MLTGMSRGSRKSIAIALDFIFLAAALWVAFVLRFGEWIAPEISHNWQLFIIAPSLACAIFLLLGIYDVVHRYTNNRALYLIAKAITLHVLILVVSIALFSSFVGMPRSVFFTYWMLGLMLTTASRLSIRSLFSWLEGDISSGETVAIYGAGREGAKLARALQPYNNYVPVAFIDDKRALHGTEIESLKVLPSDSLDQLISARSVKKVLLAIPTASRVRRKEVIEFLERFPVSVQTVPSLHDLVSGRYTLADLREISIDDLLSREPVAPDPDLMSTNITNKAVMITGAGGSIGSELARQVLKLKPEKLVLLDNSEFALYQIEHELRNYRDSINQLHSVELIPILGSVLDLVKVTRLIETFQVKTIYHAAAYKHVPLVESNPLEGIKNNVFGTWNLAQAATNMGVQTFILVSTDKAVRPTNTMGATKRLAELVIQGFASQFAGTSFSIVRFGNVLGSSGSVVPLFKKQIQYGGPITVTHPEITRFFMTIPEAAQLVIQAGSLGSRGEVFVLDMGESVKIFELAKRMVHLAGLKIKDDANPDGDIEIVFTGLRPGEKLYEETLIGEQAQATRHPRILRENEEQLSWHELSTVMDDFRTLCIRGDCGRARELLQQLVIEYKPQCEIQDYMWLAINTGMEAPDDLLVADLA